MIEIVLHKCLENKSKALKASGQLEKLGKLCNSLGDFLAPVKRDNSLSTKVNFQKQTPDEFKAGSGVRLLQKPIEKTNMPRVDNMEFEVLPNKGQCKTVPSLRHQQTMIDIAIAVGVL